MKSMVKSKWKEVELKDKHEARIEATTLLERREHLE